ncbi:hypothetical protein Taro_040602, partial [Colocasia esculenta]|nr:hypothetical protein [Colocasia esculenta]
MGGCCSCGRWTYGEPGMNYRDEEEEDMEEEFYDAGDAEDCGRLVEGGVRVRLEGSCGFASMHTQQGRKGVNQDAMTLWESLVDFFAKSSSTCMQGFAGEKDTIYCGVFDGHGPLGHRVARHVRDVLPGKLSSEYKSLHTSTNEADDDGGDRGRETQGNGDTHPGFHPWQASFCKAYKEMDEELDHRAPIDCICSGTTAVSIVKQKDHLIIANLGDSRAVLCTRDDANQPVPLQLTVDLKPNLPGEAKRITSCQGRVFAMEEEPDVHRLWLPDENSPGLAMARAFGDFCLKEFGLISTPEVTYRKLTEKDEFVVLATDGVWDVLSNKDVVRIVSSARKRSHAAKRLVDRAVRAWQEKHPTSKVDDCAAICLFLNAAPSPEEAPTAATLSSGKASPELIVAESFKTARTGSASDSFRSTNADEGAGQEWTALDGVSRSNSLTNFPRFAGLLEE